MSHSVKGKKDLQLEWDGIPSLSKSREGVIIERPLLLQFNDPVTDVLTSRTDARQLDNDDDHDKPTLGTQK